MDMSQTLSFLSKLASDAFEKNLEVKYGLCNEFAISAGNWFYIEKKNGGVFRLGMTPYTATTMLQSIDPKRVDLGE